MRILNDVKSKVEVMELVASIDALNIKIDAWGHEGRDVIPSSRDLEHTMRDVGKKMVSIADEIGRILDGYELKK